MNAPTTAFALAPEFPIFALSKDEAITVLCDSLYPGAKPQSALMVLSYCKAAGLDPMDKPVHIVPMDVSTGRKDDNGWDIKERRDVVMQGIGTYRTKAAKTGQYAGCDDAEFGPDVTETLDGVTITYPAWCRFTVYRLVSGQRVAFKATEFWKENYATKSNKSAAPNAMWKKRPYGQLSKCAEAQALRKGFPDAVGGAPTADEMEGKSFDFDLAPSGDVRPASAAPATTPAPAAASPAAPQWPSDKFTEQMVRWTKAVEAGMKSVDDILALARSKGTLTAEQEAQIRAIKKPAPAADAGPTFGDATPADEPTGAQQ